MNRIGIAVWNFPGDDLMAKVRTFAEMGYNAASVQGEFLDAFSPDDFTAGGDALHELDLLLTVHTGFVSADGAVSRDVVCSQAERILSWHASMGRVACLTYDAPWKEISPGAYRIDPTAIAETFEEVLLMSSGSGVRVALEDWPLRAEDMEECAGWPQKYPHWGVLIGLGHMNMRLREPKDSPRPIAPGATEAYLRAIPAQIVELHVHSNNGTRDQHAPPYMGNTEMASAARALRDVSFGGISTIEMVPSWCGLSPDDAIPAARQSLRYWKDLLA